LQETILSFHEAMFYWQEVDRPVQVAPSLALLSGFESQGKLNVVRCHLMNLVFMGVSTSEDIFWNPPDFSFVFHHFLLTVDTTT
jgi:hypothetical protein